MSMTEAQPVKIAQDLTRSAAPAHQSVVFDVQSVGVSYDGNLAVREVTMPIYAKQVTAIIGPSGCGKSTFIRVFNRMNDLIPSAEVHGKVLYHGEDLYGKDVDLRRGAQADRDGLPEAEPVSEVDLRQRRVRAARARLEEGRSTSGSRLRCTRPRSGTRSRTG